MLYLLDFQYTRYTTHSIVCSGYILSGYILRIISLSLFFSQSFDALFIETSAKDNCNIEEAVIELVR